MAAGYPAGVNTFVPNFDAGGQLIVAYSRNPKDFAINKYVTITPVKKGLGYYLRITAEVAGRVLETDLKDRVWHDGNDAPNLSWGNEAFEFQKYLTERYVYGFRLGYKAVDQADWKIMASHAAIAAQAAMTSRTVLALGVLTTTSNYDANHTDTATNLGGAVWSAGTVAAPTIKKGLEAAAQKIHQDTLGAVGPKDLVLVVNPVDAGKMSASDEMQDMFKHGLYSKPWFNSPEQSEGRWGLPDNVWGFKTVVEDTVKVTSAKGATRTTGYALPTGTALLLARPGSLIGQEGAASFSTGHFFVYEEMAVEQRDDPDNRRTVGRIIDDIDFRVVAPSAGYVITGI